LSDELIPYISEPRPDTGVTNGKLGIWLFLASEVMLFGGFFSAYVLLRAGSGEGQWFNGQDVLNTWLGMANTFILITSSVTMVMAWAALKLDGLAKCRMYLTATVVLAIAFLVIKIGWEYTPKLHHYQVTYTMTDEDGEASAPIVATGHLESETQEQIVFVKDDTHEEITIASDDIVRLSTFGPGLNNYMGIYWTMTGLHGLHVLGGIVVIAWFIGPGVALYRQNAEHYAHRIEYVGLYWHFVDLVWIFLFPVLYLL
jgi:cytochrome c oxidase subunit 3